MSQSITLDLTNYKDRVGSRVAPGTYRVIVDDAETDESKAGNPMVNTWLRILDGPYAGNVLTDRMVLTEKSLFRIVGFMQAIGIPTPKKRVAINLRQFVGKILLVEVDDGDPYNGRVKSEVRGYSRAVNAEGTDPIETDASDLEDLEGGETAEPEAGPASGGSGTDDDGPVDLDSLNL